MKHTGRSILIVISSILLCLAASSITFGQTTPSPAFRMVEVNGDFSARSDQRVVLGGRAYIPLTDRILTEVNLDFKTALTGVLQPSDQITGEGKAYVFLTPLSECRSCPFVSGGFAQSFLIDSPIPDGNATQAKGSFGFLFRKPSGFAVMPMVTISTDDVQGGPTYLGKSYLGEVRLFIPIGSSFSFNANPYAGREYLPIVGRYESVVGFKIGFGRRF